MSPFDAWHLPGLEPDAWQEYRYEDLVVRAPALEPADIDRVAEIARAGGQRLKTRSTRDVVRAIADAGATLADPDHELHRQAVRLLPPVTGYSTPMIRLVLERMTGDWSAEALERLLRSELGRVDALDGFHPDGERKRMAVGPNLAFHSFAGNVPGVAVTATIRSLLVRAATLGKTASGDPVLPILFARALERAAPDLARALALSYWPGNRHPLTEAAIRHADTVVVYGGEEATADLADRVRPPARLLIHGPRLSLAIIAREALADEEAAARLADHAARAVAICDQQGCVSPHAIFVEEGGSVTPAAFAEQLAERLARLQEELPRGRLDPETASRIRQLRGGAEFAGIEGRATRALGDPGLGYTVLYDEGAAFHPSPLHRTVQVRAIQRVDPLQESLRDVAPYLQSIALEAEPPRREELGRKLGLLGASRITNLRRMPWPPPEWHHDGRGPLVELIRWVDLED